MTMGRGGIFGNPVTFGGALPDMGEPMFGNRPTGIDEAATGQFPAPKRKGGIFGGGARNIAGVIGDMLLQASGSRPMFLPMLMKQRQAEQERAQAEAQRQQQFEDWRQRFDYERANTPVKNDAYRWRNNAGDLMEVGPDGQPRVVYDDPTDKLDWIKADNGDGTFTMVPVGPSGPVGQSGPANQAPPPKPVGKLRPLGDAGSNASGGFQY